MKDRYLDIYGVDASQMKGKPKDVFFAKTVEEVKEIVKSNDKISIRAGGTGLAGGAVPSTGVDAILDLSKLDKIGEFDNGQKLITVGAGVILDDLQEYLSEYNLEFPVKPSSHAVCTIGGMISTNAVGNRAIKYGKTSNWIKWIEIVDCMGQVSRKGITEISDYSGMEGITGVIVRACLKLSERKLRTADLIKIENLNELTEKISELKRNRDVSALEFLDKTLSEKVGLEKSYHIIAEYENNSGKLKAKDYREIFAKRDSAYPIAAKEGFARIEDPKVMPNKLPELINWLEKRGIPCFGHVAVGILHPCFNIEQEKLIPDMMKLVKRLGGQISGEHGVGILKKSFVEFNDKKIWENVKKRTDSLNKFNVGKVV